MRLFPSAYAALTEERRAARRLRGKAFEDAVGHVTCVLESIASRHDSADVAWALEHAFSGFRKALQGAGQSLSDEQRDGLLRAAAVARLGVEIYTSGHERDVFVEGLRALQSLTVHHSQRSGSDCLIESEIADLWSWTKTARNTADNIVERSRRSERERLRTLPLTDAPRNGRGRAA